ncbi:MAG: NUDIX hydrolase [Ilumatobacteraceae bacterium]
MAPTIVTMRWTVHGERSVYASDWMSLSLVDVELPSGARFEHHVMRTAPAAGVVVDDPERGVLLLWRHRFISDTWGWEVPAGRVDEGETPVEAGSREVLEETGWRPGALTRLTSYFPNNGATDCVFHLFVATSAEQVGERSDIDEAERIEWLSWPEISAAIAAEQIGDGLSLTALLLRMRMRESGPGHSGE